MARFYELEVIEGPLKDRRWKLVVGQRYRVGRTGREIPLFQDDAASLEHAEISWAADGWWIRDLGSEKGTQIDGVAVDETGRVFPVGALAVVGNTTLKLTMQHGIPAWVGWTAAIGVPVAATLVALTALAVKPIRYDPVVVFDRPVPQGDVTSSEVRIPDSFIRRFGVDHRTLAQRRITDFDADGRSELWLRVRDHEVVVEADGRDFETLGDLPTGCVDEATGLGFPDLKCGGVRWTFQGDRYVATELDGAVAWLAPLVDTLDPDSGTTQRIASHPRPVRVSMLHPERLAGFLRGRGVVEPIHYLLCEEAVPGGKAQVRTASGRVVPLDVGCHDVVDVSGPGRETAFDAANPVAVAFTASGLAAVPADVAGYLSSGPDGMFLDASRRDALAAMSGPPQTEPYRLTFLTEPGEGDAVAAEAGTLAPVALVHRADRDAPRPVFTVSVDSPGVAEVAPGGCARLRIEAAPMHCLLRRACTPGRTFLTVDEVGCGEPVRLLEIPYAATDAQSVGEDVEVAVRTDVYSAKGQLDVLRVRLGVRASIPPAP